MVARLVVVALLLGWLSLARADQWISPTPKTVTSPSGTYKALVAPAKDGTSGATVTIDPPKGASATYTLRSPWMPVDVVVFDDGTLLAMDHWHRLGYGDVATLYERDGSVRWTKTLVQLVGQTIADGADHSVSSIWWRKLPLEWSLAKDRRSILVTLYDEDQLRLALADGAASIVAVASLPDDPARLVARAKALAGRPGQEAAAAALFERVIAKDPEHLEAIRQYVELAQRTKDDARAVALLERVAPRWKQAKGYNVANVYVAWGASLVTLGRPADAERVLRLGVAAAPTYPNPALALATLLADQQRPKDADVVLDGLVAQLLKASYLDDYALAAAAAFYRQRKEPRKARRIYLQGYKRDQVTNQFLYASLAEVHEELGELADAIRVHEQLLAHYAQLGSSFDSYAKQSREALDRLRAQPASKPKRR